MKTEDKENKSMDQTGNEGGESSKGKDSNTTAQQEPQPSTSSTFPNSPEASNSVEAKDALFEVGLNCKIKLVNFNCIISSF